MKMGAIPYQDIIAKQNRPSLLSNQAQMENVSLHLLAHRVQIVPYWTKNSYEADARLQFLGVISWKP